MKTCSSTVSYWEIIEKMECVEYLQNNGELMKDIDAYWNTHIDNHWYNQGNHAEVFLCVLFCSETGSYVA